MPKFGKRSTDNLSEAHPDLQTVFNEVVKHFDCTVIEGQRTEAEQNEVYRRGLSKLKFPNSKHNKCPSEAVDVLPYPIDWNDTNRMRYFAGFVVGIASMMKDREIIDHNIRWGGDWNKDTELKDNRFQDLPHFEIY